MRHLFIDILAWGTIFSSVLVIVSVNPVIAVIFLISVFCNAAGFLILLGVGFIGISYLIIYVGAITVLFLFVIMMFNIKLSDIVNTQAQINANMAFVIAITGLFVYEMKWILPFAVNDISGIPSLLLHESNKILLSSNTVNNVLNTFNPNIADTSFTSFLQIETLGEGLYTYGAPLLISCSMLLLLAMIAPIFISGKFKGPNPHEQMIKIDPLFYYRNFDAKYNIKKKDDNWN
jgi:NADH-ubiquinone oxidoreductase chain 6